MPYDAEEDEDWMFEAEVCCECGFDFEDCVCNDYDDYADEEGD